MRRPNQFGKFLVLTLSVFLVFFMTAEIAHTHSGDAASLAAMSHCQLCMTAHVASADQPAWLTAYVLHLIGQVSIGEPSLESHQVIFSSFIRPPPADFALA